MAFGPILPKALPSGIRPEKTTGHWSVFYAAWGSAANSLRYMDVNPKGASTEVLQVGVIGIM